MTTIESEREKDKKIIETIIFAIVEEIKVSNISFSKNFEDGRTNSAINEKEILKFILANQKIKSLLNKMKWKLTDSKPREWYDLAIEGETSEYFVPINLKITSLDNNSGDNLNSKGGIYFALTGNKPDFSNQINWNDYFQKLHDNIKENYKDYYFLIIDKNNLKESFYTSLKQIETLVSNGNNLPFQCIWSKNKNLKYRTYNEAKQFILHYLRESIEKRANILNDFNKYFTKKGDENE
ncbi:hypothetical protein [Mycoplasma sp. 5370]